MLGKIEGQKGREWQRRRWLDSITDSMDMNLSKLWRWWGQRSMTCCSPWGLKELNMTYWLNNNNSQWLELGVFTAGTRFNPWSGSYTVQPHTAAKKYHKGILQIYFHITANKVPITEIKTSKKMFLTSFSLFLLISLFFFTEISSEVIPILMIFNSCPPILSETYSKMTSVSTIPTELLQGYLWPSRGPIEWPLHNPHLTWRTRTIRSTPSLFLACKACFNGVLGFCTLPVSPYLSDCPFSVFFANSSSDPQLSNFECSTARSSGCLISAPLPIWINSMPIIPRFTSSTQTHPLTSWCVYLSSWSTIFSWIFKQASQH